jgi:hypothetical protein
MNPRVERRLRLFEKNDALQTGRVCGFHRQIAGDGVERSRHCQDDVLHFQPKVFLLAGDAVVPGVAEMRQEPHLRFER